MLPLSFVRFCFRSSTTQLLFFRSCSSRFRLTVAFTMLRFPFRFPVFPILSTRFPVFLSWFSVLGFLLVPFHPSRFRSRSCFPGAYLLLSLSVLAPSFPLSFVRFFSGSDYSGSALSFPFFPVFHRIWSFRCLFIRFPFRLFPCFPFSFGTQPYCNFFSPFSLFRVTVTTQLPTFSAFASSRSP